MEAKTSSGIFRSVAAGLIGLAVLVQAGCASRSLSGGAPLRGTTSRVDVDVRASVQAAPARGYIQVPKGGQPGTTSPKRPRVGELGNGTAWRPVLDVKASWRRHQLHVGGAWISLQGDNRLTEDLLTQGDAYPAGTDISSSTSLHEAWVGYRYLFDLGAAPGDRLTVAPGLGIYSLGMHYLLSGSNGEEANRSYTGYSPMVEAEIEWDPTGPIRFSSEIRAIWDEALGLSSPTNAFDACIRIHGDFWRKGGLFAEVGYYRGMHYDHQEVPNDYDVELAPYVGLGGQFRF